MSNQPDLTKLIKTVPDVSSSDESESESKKPSTQRKPYDSNQWVEQQTFSDKQECMAAIESEQTWVTTFENFTNAGRKVHYRCKKVKARSKNQ